MLFYVEAVVVVEREGVAGVVVEVGVVGLGLSHLNNKNSASMIVSIWSFVVVRLKVWKFIVATLGSSGSSSLRFIVGQDIAKYLLVGQVLDSLN